MYLLKVLTQNNVYLLDRTFYYLSDKDVKEGVRVKINFHNSSIVGYVVSSEFKNKSKDEIEDDLGINLAFIEEIIDQEPILNENLLKLAYELKKRYMYPLIGVFQTMLPPSLKPKKTYENSAKVKEVEYYYLNKEKISENIFNNNEKKLLEKFRGKEIIAKRDLGKSKTLNSLVEKGIILIKKEEKYRYELKQVFNDYEKEIVLSSEQERAFKKILNEKEKPVLLKGVTGSGKTEIYIKLIQEVKKEGKGAIILVPEIALTPLMISRLYNFFKDDIAVLHSSLTDAELYDEYRKISDGKADIVIGTRSAIFAPVSNLGLIIIDEENDECYKQDDQGLLYNAKEVALMRMKIEVVKVVLGSATPAIEDYAKAKNNIYTLVELNNRFSDQPLPDVFLIDNTNYRNFSTQSNVFSLELIRQLKMTLLEGKQAILFINRRGFSNYLICKECGHVFKCPHCGLPLHYHKEKNILYCHHCEYKEAIPHNCPKCDSKYLGFGQFGIEKVEEDFKKLFPSAKYLVLDSDRTKKTFQIEAVLKAFNNNEAQVLIGTQIVAKGHDFNNVKLVGVLNADTLLNFPNYRSNEMTFSMLTQVIGRCGRKKDKGIAVIQSSATNNYAILSAVKQDYESFYIEELKNRKRFKNPPFNSILAIEISSKNAANLEYFIPKIKNFFLSLRLEDVYVYGPSILNYTKYKSWKFIFVKYKKLVDLVEPIENLLAVYKAENKIKISLNFNPYSF